MMARKCLILSMILGSLLLLPSRALACACCAEPGEYGIRVSKPSAHELGLVKRMRFGPAANLFTTGAGREENAKGLPNPLESYSLAGSFAGDLWKLLFRDGNTTGALTLPLPAKMLRYRADIHDGQSGGGGGPLLYKEWRFEGLVRGTGFFRPGTIASTRYFLVLQGRGNNCDNAEDFTHWRLEISGRKAAYSFYGELAKPIADATN
jgi:hypothetical protein